MNFGLAATEYRTLHGSPLRTESRVALQDSTALSTHYTPGVAAPCRAIAEDPSLADTLTIRRRSVAVVSDGSAVLGLGNIGPAAALPVMEGKCLILREFADLDGFPVVLATQDTSEIVETIARIAPSYGAINLEDISAPRCFEIEQQLQQRLPIPVFHDDQHGTAMVVLAGLLNALRLFPRPAEQLRIVIAGAGAAGIAIGDLLRAWGAQRITMVDSQGIISTDRQNLNLYKQRFAVEERGSLAVALRGADVFIGVSGAAGSVTPEMIATMAEKPLLFALSNPDPEVDPTTAWEAGAAVVATGRSDYPNQLNNALVYPHLFKGLLEYRLQRVTPEMMLAIATALAASLTDGEVTPERIIPDVFDSRVQRSIMTAMRHLVRVRS